jgi:hypothetical protein
MLLRAIRRIPERYRPLAGTLALLLAAWASMYGKIWYFETKSPHRFTAKALLTGTLRLRGMVTAAGHDEQVYNGAIYTNWGFGVPILQVPFQLLAGLVKSMHGFFPDRAIYFLYLGVMMPILWAAFDRLLAMKEPPGSSRGWRLAVSWTTTWMVLNVTLFPFMSTRFLMYEEAISYLMIFELLALSAYVFALRSWRPVHIAAMAAAAGIGLLVRPIGLVYLAVWGLLVPLERRSRVQRTLLFGIVAAPFVAFFFYSNWVRSGSPLGLGYGNSNPAWDYETPILRFGSLCQDTPAHFLATAGRLFNSFFFYVTSHPASAWMKHCHFGLEERDKAGDPFFGPGILVLLVGMLYGLIRRRERRLFLYVPHAAIVALFGTFVARGDGFAWRYVGDFWPLILLASVQYVLTLPAAAVMPYDLRLTKIMFWTGFAAMARFWVPWEWDYRADVLHPQEVDALEGQFEAARWQTEGPLPTRLSCDKLPDPDVPYHNGLGWKPGCSVGTYTNVYLGVLPRAQDHYTLRFETQGVTDATLKVYVNGGVYTARRSGDTYEADVTIHYAALTSPSVMITLLWTRDNEPPPVKLLSIELV